MLFTSLEFLLLFLPIVVLVNTVLPEKIRNIWLLLASLFFYAWGEPSFVVVMIGTVLYNYLFALMIDCIKTHLLIRKILLIIDITANLGILFVYKYMNLSTSILHQFDSNIVVTDYILPIGISFYTFQAISYVIDVYRGERAQFNIVDVGLYIALFPQLIAGPIVRYSDIKEQLINRKTSFKSFEDGIYRFLIGFNKKMLLANMLAIIADKSFDMTTSRTVFMAWFGAISYSLQIYYDFSGYSDMAIGLGKVMGFELPNNFDFPYISKSVTEFWRRWHQSLGQWFRDYLYFPLGGSKVQSKARLIFNLMLVWLMTGIWHGANLTFILWGCLFGVIISFEKVLSLPAKFSKNWLYRFFSIIMIIVGWVIFRSEHINDAMQYMLDMFGFGEGGFVEKTDVFLLREYGIYLLMGIICAIPIMSRCIGKIKEDKKVCIEICIYLINIAMFLVGISYLVISAHNPFIYFNF